MKMEEEIGKMIMGFHDKKPFEVIAHDLFIYQYANNLIYQQFADLNSRQPSQVDHLEMIPFLPVSLFKHHRIFSGEDPGNNVLTFFSSGTSRQSPATHLIKEPELYQQSFFRGFERVFGPPSGYQIFALLPSYLERGNSSLVYMVDYLIKSSKTLGGGFFIKDYPMLQARLKAALSDTRQKTMLIGVTYALLEFMKRLSFPLHDLIVVETGGMKGHGKEMVREELYQTLKKGYGVTEIASEYGMTELCSQAWSLDQGIYHPPPWMKIMIRDLNDPKKILSPGKRGALNVIDFANLHSCAFLATDDIGLVHHDGSFEVLGRIDGSETRGCNLMAL